MWTNYTRELEVQAWVALFAILVTAALVLAFTTTISPLEQSRCSLADAIFLTFGALCGQSKFLNIYENLYGFCDQREHSSRKGC